MKNYSYIDKIKPYIINYAANFITAVLILIIGLWLSKVITKTLKRVLISRNIEITLVEFLEDLTYWTIRGFVVIAVISKLGVETSSFVAVLGAAGLALGLSLQGSLANFAGGILIILFKPFKVGDKIDAQGEIGRVDDIHIFSTKLVTANNQTVYIPNGILSNGKIKNYSQKEVVRNDFEINFSKTDNCTEKKLKIEKIISSHKLVLQQPKPEVFISNISEESFTLLVRIWADYHDITQAKSDILEAI